MLNAALTQQDERKLQVQGVDAIVRKVLYHKSCYGSFTQNETLEKLTQNEVKAEITAPIHRSVHQQKNQLMSSKCRNCVRT